MSSVAEHYYQTNQTARQSAESSSQATEATASHQQLWQSIVSALQNADIQLTDLNTDLLAPIDQLHIGGRQATIKLLNDAGIQSHSQGIEIGSGLGGTARLIADQFDAEITAIDITQAFTFACEAINQQLGYQRITSLCADACVPQVPAKSQDFVISQHTLMNIPDKQLALKTLADSLKEGGLLLLHEVFAGENKEALKLPVPWASEQEHSHLPQFETLDQLLADAGFVAVRVEDVTEQALAWRTKHSQRESGSADKGHTQQKSPLNPQLIFGKRFVNMGKNLMANLADNKVRVVEAIYRLEKP